MVSDAAQLNVVESGTGIATLITSQDSRDQLWGQLTTMAGEVGSGNTFVMGQIAGNLVPLGAAGKLGKTGTHFGKVDKFGLAKPIKFSTPSNTTSALDWVKSHLGGGEVKVSDEFTPARRTPDGVDPNQTVPPRLDPRKAEVERLNNAGLGGYERFDTALENRSKAQGKLGQATEARNPTLAELRELGIEISPNDLTKGRIGKPIAYVLDQVDSRVDLSPAAKDTLEDLLEKLEKQSFAEREALIARNNMSRDLGEEAAAAYREALGETEILYRPNAVRDRFDLVTQSQDGNKLIFTEAKGGDATLSKSGRKVDGVPAGQGSTIYFNDLFQKDPEFRAWLDENPDVLRKLQNGEMTVEYQMVKARPEGTVETYNLVLDQSAMVLE